MKIGLIGYGKMGKMIEQAAVERGHSIPAKIDPSLNTPFTEEAAASAEILIEFTRPESTFANIAQAAGLGKNIVVGTTGWYDRLEEASKLIENSGTALFYAPNFSIGVNLFLALSKYAGSLFPKEGYEAAGIEMHHKHKVDAPSGTALAIEQAYGTPLPFESVRCGNVPGTHTLFLDSPEDSVTLTHTARNRNGFAVGAVKAAEWLQGKRGIFTMQDMLKDEVLT